MYHNQQNQQQFHYLPSSQSQYYAASYPHYSAPGASISAHAYAPSSTYDLGMGTYEAMSVGAIHPSGVDRTSKMDRRRPKYTRSKLGCLTCRRKKVKCDEAKPNCTRCANSGLGCTWPEAPPPKKKASSSRSTSKRATDSPVSPTGPISSSTSISNPEFTSTSGSDCEASRPATAIAEDELKLEEGNDDVTPLHTLSLSSSVTLNDRRHSEPQFAGLLPAVTVASLEGRRHSTVEGLTTHQTQQQAQEVAYGPGALGLTLNQLHSQEQVKLEGRTPALSYSSLGSQSRAESRSGSRPSTPNDHFAQQQQSGFPPAGGNGWGLNLSLPTFSGASTANSSRPSTASSLSLSHVNGFRRASATSFGTGGGSPPTTGGSAAVPCVQNSPFQYQMSKPYGDVSAGSSIDMAATGMAHQGSFAMPRPSTAGSISPRSAMNMQTPGEGIYARRGSLDGRVHVPSPLMHQSSSPLAQPQPSHSQQNYFTQLNHYPAGTHSRSESPWGTRTY